MRPLVNHCGEPISLIAWTGGAERANGDPNDKTGCVGTLGGGNAAADGMFIAKAASP
jgi:hypothetical protein